MTKCKRCGSGIAARCEGCVAELSDRQTDRIEALRNEVTYLRLRCAEEGVAVHVPSVCCDLHTEAAVYAELACQVC